MNGLIGFTGSPLDRMAPSRNDPQALATLAADPAALLLDMPDYVPAIADGALAWRPFAPLPLEQTLLLGLIDGIPRFARIDPAATDTARSAVPTFVFDRFNPACCSCCACIQPDPAASERISPP